MGQLVEVLQLKLSESVLTAKREMDVSYWLVLVGEEVVAVTKWCGKGSSWAFDYLPLPLPSFPELFNTVTTIVARKRWRGRAATFRECSEPSIVIWEQATVARPTRKIHF
jgi:hypothetical protein